jgi:myosin heavy subunit
MAKVKALIGIETDIGNSDVKIKKLDKEVDKLNKSARATKKDLKGAADAVSDMGGPIGGAIDGVKGLARGFMSLLANPIGLIIGGIVLAMTALYAIFSDFAPLMDFISDKMAYLNGLFQGLRSAIFNFITGVEGSTVSITDQANAMQRANQLTRDYEDSLDSLALKQAQYEAQIDKLLKQAKNKSISDQEANKLLAEATRLQNEQIRLLKESSKLETSALIEKAKGYGATYKQILAIQKGASIASLGNLSNELDEALRALQQNYTKRVGEEGQLEEKKEKIKNAYDAKDESRKAKEAKRLEEEKKKRDEEEKAFAAQLEKKKKFDAEYSQSKIHLEIVEQEEMEKLDEQRMESQNEYDNAILKSEEDALKERQRIAEQDKKILEEEIEARMAFANQLSGLLNTITNLMGEQSEEGKAIAAAATLIDTYVASFRAYKEGLKYGQVFAILSAAAAAATGLKAVQNILNTDAKGTNTTPSNTTASAPPPITRPSSSFVQLDNRGPLDVNNVGMTKVVVVESDITQVQNQVSSIKAKATIG